MLRTTGASPLGEPVLRACACPTRLFAAAYSSGLEECSKGADSAPEVQAADPQLTARSG